MPLPMPVPVDTELTSPSPTIDFLAPFLDLLRSSVQHSRRRAHKKPRDPGPAPASFQTTVLQGSVAQYLMNPDGFVRVLTHGKRGEVKRRSTFGRHGYTLPATGRDAIYGLVTRRQRSGSDW